MLSRKVSVQHYYQGMKMNQCLIALSLLLFTLTATAANTPCSGRKGGISHCYGEKFLCRDGSMSQSKKNCQTY
jgi:hypothetical protein